MNYRPTSIGYICSVRYTTDKTKNPYGDRATIFVSPNEVYDFHGINDLLTAKLSETLGVSASNVSIVSSNYDLSAIIRELKRVVKVTTTRKFSPNFDRIEMQKTSYTRKPFDLWEVEYYSNYNSRYDTLVKRSDKIDSWRLANSWDGFILDYMADPQITTDTYRTFTSTFYLQVPEGVTVKDAVETKLSQLWGEYSQKIQQMCHTIQSNSNNWGNIK